MPRPSRVVCVFVCVCVMVEYVLVVKLVVKLVVLLHKVGGEIVFRKI